MCVLDSLCLWKCIRGSLEKVCFSLVIWLQRTYDHVNNLYIFLPFPVGHAFKLHLLFCVSDDLCDLRKDFLRWLLGWFFISIVLQRLLGWLLMSIVVCISVIDCNGWVYRGANMDIVLPQRDLLNDKSEGWQQNCCCYWKSAVHWFWGISSVVYSYC